MRRLDRAAAAAAWIACCLPAWRRFRAALSRPREVQLARLRALLQGNADSEYGRRHGFAGIRCLEEYQTRVPVVRYDDLGADVAAMARGTPAVLTSGRVIAMERTTGSSGVSKLIPYTRALLAEFQEALGAWMADLHLGRPSLLAGPAYWSISPLGTPLQTTEGGIPIGFEEDTRYFEGMGSRFLTRLLVTPPGLARAASFDECRRRTVEALRSSADLRFISVWHPSFLTLLLDAAGPIVPRSAWPRLAVISCWADAAAAGPADELHRLFPGVEIQPKGLLATEGVVSIPVAGRRGAALAVTSHVLELVDEARPDAPPRLADELEEGRTYSVLITTGGGLYRYALGDRIRVVGYERATPLVEFVGKESLVSDLCGEKLHAARVGEVIDASCRAVGLRPGLAMLAPEEGPPPGYVLFVEADGVDGGVLEELARRVEAGLQEGSHYAYCRRLGQLAPLRLFRARPGATRAYVDRCASLGQRAGSVKPTALHRETGWARHFEGAFH